MDASFENQIEIPPYDQPSDSLEASAIFYKQMARRRSIRSFSSQTVEREVLINAIKTAGTAPSGANRQPWHFALISSQTIKDQVRIAAEAVEQEFYNEKAPQYWLDDLKPFGTSALKPYLSEAPALIAVFSRAFCESEKGETHRSYYPLESTGIAVGLLIASLHNAGLATLTHTPKPMFFLNEVLKLDKSYKPFMIVVAGYAKQPVCVPNVSRKPLYQIMSEY